MFSPATRKSRVLPRKDRTADYGSPDSPSTPAAEGLGSFSSPAVPHRPSTGTPAPWTSRLSVLARVSSTRNLDKVSDADQIQPIYVAEIPQILRKTQMDCIQKKVVGTGGFSGGMDKVTSLSWMICEKKLFIWSYLSPSLSSKCVVVDFPSSVLGLGDITADCNDGKHWMVCILEWKTSAKIDKGTHPCDSAGVIICHQKTHTLVYWPNVFSESGRAPVVWLSSFEESNDSLLFHDRGVPDEGVQGLAWTENGCLVADGLLNSMIAATIPGSSQDAVALACHSSGELYYFYCTPVGITCRVDSHIAKDFHSRSVGSPTSKVFARSLIWRFQSSEETSCQFLLLVDHEIQCWNIIVSPDAELTKLWSHEIVGADGDLGIKKDLAGQKHIWLLDIKTDKHGKEFTLLVATSCKDRASSSSYTQYSLLTMQYRPGQNVSVEDYSAQRVLERKSPLQVIIPKARVEDESVLLSMRLHVGGKPSGSAIILSGDGTATVTNYWRGSTRLYKFDLPYDAGKVLDASVFPSSENNEEGAWVVLTEKAGIWAIPEKAVLLGGVEPPKRSLSRKGSSNERVAEEEKRSTTTFYASVAQRGSSSISCSDLGRQQAFSLGLRQRTAQDEEAEVLLGRLFHDFLVSGEVDDVFEKLRNSGAFEKEGEMNVFARMSKSIVDTLAKHWTTSRGPDFVGSAAIVSQLLDKKQKHERFLQFLALSKCHEELSSKQRHSLQIIVEHGEKLFGMIQLRELQNFLSQNKSNENDSSSFNSFKEPAGSLWDLIQLVGEKARRHTVLLMDRDNAEVFYSKVSVIEELFYSLSHHIQYVIGEDQHFMIQIRRTYEVSSACVTLIHASIHYRNEHQTWYPSPEALITWNCQPVVQSGLWSIASALMQLFKQASLIPLSVKSELCSQLETLADILLESYTSSITARREQGEELKGLIEEYHNRRDTLLDSLYHQASDSAEIQYKERCKETEDAKLKETIFREVSLPLLSIAKRHEGYLVLWNICYDLHDAGLLRSLMHESVGPMRGFSYFVFKQLYGRQQYSKLLRLGEEFQDDLTIFLKQHKDKLWLHEVFLNNFSSASDTLHALANSVDEGALVIKGSSKSDQPKQEPSLAERKRHLNLAKIAAAAGKCAGFEMKIRCIEADLQILALQEEILKQFPDGMEIGVATSKLLPPKELIEMCLKAKTRELSLCALEVFAWTGSSFRLENKSLLEESWRNAADQDDWLVLSQASLSEGWSDEVSTKILKETILFKASNMCYGPEAERYEGSFEDVMAIQKDNVQYTNFKGPVSSLEEILMQHKDFPDAGKLMVMAVLLGKIGYEVEENSEMLP